MTERRAGMTAAVGDRFGGDAIGGDLHRGREVAEAFVGVDDHLDRRRQAVRLALQRADQAELVERRRAQVIDGVAYAGDCRVDVDPAPPSAGR